MSWIHDIWYYQKGRGRYPHYSQNTRCNIQAQEITPNPTRQQKTLSQCGLSTLCNTNNLAGHMPVSKEALGHQQTVFYATDAGAAFPTARSFLITEAISIAVAAASYPLFPTLPPARSIACSIVSVVMTPKITGTPADDISSCGVKWQAEEIQNQTSDSTYTETIKR